MKFTTWQRMMCSIILGNMEGNVATLRQAGKILDVLEFTEEEKKRIGLQSMGQSFMWDDRETEWDLDLSADQISFLKTTIKNHDRWPASARKEVFDLFEKLGIDS